MSQDSITGGKIWQPEAEPKKIVFYDDPMISVFVKQTFTAIMGFLGIYVFIRFFPEILALITQLVEFIGGTNV